MPASRREPAVHRALDHYLHTARGAHARFNSELYPLEGASPQDKTLIEAFDSSEQAMDWFDAEHQVLLAVTALAASTGFDSHAWQIPANLVRYLYSRGHWNDWAGMQHTALTAAERLGDKNVQASVLRASGLLCLRQATYEQAQKHFDRALRLYRELGDQAGQARTYGDLSMSFSIQGRYREALAHSERALDLSRSAGHPYVHAVVLNKVGWNAAHLGDYQRALACCRQALGLFQGLGNRFQEACVRDSLGYVHGRLGHHAESIDCYQRASTLFREIGSRFELADTLGNLGDACESAGRPAAARDAWREAFTILNGLHHPGAARLDAKLRQHDTGQPANKQRAEVSCSCH